MQVELKLVMSIELVDEFFGIREPEADDPLELRMKESAGEAVREAIQHGENRGFNHDMEDTTSLSLVSLEVVKGRCPWTAQFPEAIATDGSMAVERGVPME